MGIFDAQEQEVIWIYCSDYVVSDAEARTRMMERVKAIAGDADAFAEI